MPKPGQTEFTALAFIGLLLLFSIVPFWPGTSGDYIFDDRANLTSIGDMGGVVSLDSLRQFAFSGVASSFGRPISLLSFTLDAQDWPAEPYSFKRTNILLHSANTLLLFGFVFALFHSLHRQRVEALAIAFFTALIWAIQPLHTSTVLYVIQRMAELSTLFILAALWFYVHGRRRLEQNPGLAYLWMSSAIIIGGVLAFFSKETGILLPLFVLIIELTLLNKLPRPKHWRYWATPFLGLPLLVIIAYFGYTISDSTARFALRDFSLYERLLTESRVLFEYLYNVVVPLQTPTVYNDGFVISKGLFEPISTLFAVVSLIILLGLAAIWRSRQPVLSFAIFWFFGAHLLESTVLPLEIYFEHRNYPALIGSALAMAYYAWPVILKKPKVFVPTTLIVISTLSVMTFKHSNTWGDPSKLIEAWNIEYPSSVRARTKYMVHQLKTNKLDKSLELAKAMHSSFPDDLGTELNLVTNLCFHNLLTNEAIIHLLDSMKRHHIDDITLINLKFLTRSIHNHSCKQIQLQGAEKFVETLLSNPTNRTPSQTQTLYQIKSEINRSLRKFEPTYTSLKQAFETIPSINMAIKLAELTATIKRYDLVKYHLSTALLLDKKRSLLLPSRETKIQQAQQRLLLEQHNNSRYP